MACSALFRPAALASKMFCSLCRLPLRFTRLTRRENHGRTPLDHGLSYLDLLGRTCKVVVAQKPDRKTLTLETWRRAWGRNACFFRRQPTRMAKLTRNAVTTLTLTLLLSLGARLNVYAQPVTNVSVF